MSEIFYSPGTVAIVVEPHQASFRNALVLRTGDCLEVGQRDDTWPMYLWCIGPDGTEGWVPEVYLEQGPAGWQAARNYSTAELTVVPGARLNLEKEVGGWVWGATPAGEWGGIPKEKLKFISPEVAADATDNNVSEVDDG